MIKLSDLLKKCIFLYGDRYKLGILNKRIYKCIKPYQGVYRLDKVFLMHHY